MDKVALLKQPKKRRNVNEKKHFYAGRRINADVFMRVRCLNALLSKLPIKWPHQQWKIQF